MADAYENSNESNRIQELEEVLEDARKWLAGQPERSQCKATTLTELLQNINKVLGKEDADD
ncbi:hypothetical protein [Mesorhizobium sp. SP-1A]|uniref:hypothetical protein n=1 Tax=Mesorhizobium sp. SP-1A TaxID=3077840 RepID=UPI0028F6DBC5|nr:hypothetical protein [Mesorhizobium sp. SP-1A]